MDSKQGQVMPSLEQFLAQAGGPSTSWADVVDDIETYDEIEPEPPASVPEVEPLRSARNTPLPSSPPYTLFCGNLSFDIKKEDLERFFAPIKVASVKIVLDNEKTRPKGFAYVEFESRDDLAVAVERNGRDLLKRKIILDPHTRRGGGGFSGRSRGGGSASRGAHHGQEPAGPPAQRAPLKLSKRTVAVETASTARPAAKLDPFGGCRPREEVLKAKAEAEAMKPSPSPTAPAQPKVVLRPPSPTRSGTPQSRKELGLSDLSRNTPIQPKKEEHIAPKSAWGPSGVRRAASLRCDRHVEVHVNDRTNHHQQQHLPRSDRHVDVHVNDRSNQQQHSVNNGPRPRTSPAQRGGHRPLDLRNTDFNDRQHPRTFKNDSRPKSTFDQRGSRRSLDSSSRPFPLENEDRRPRDHHPNGRHSRDQESNDRPQDTRPTDPPMKVSQAVQIQSNEPRSQSNESSPIPTRSTPLSKDSTVTSDISKTPQPNEPSSLKGSTAPQSKESSSKTKPSTNRNVSPQKSAPISSMDSAAIRPAADRPDASSGFEVARKGRRPSRNPSASTASKCDTLDAKSKAAPAHCDRTRSASRRSKSMNIKPQLPSSSFSYSSNMFADLAADDD